MTAPAAHAEPTGEYTSDPTRLRTGFAAPHAMTPKVRSAFDEFDDNAHIDSNNPKAHRGVTSKIDDIDTDRDVHLRSNNFPKAADHPEGTFGSIPLERTRDELLPHHRRPGDQGPNQTDHSALQNENSVQDPFDNARFNREALAIKQA